MFDIVYSLHYFYNQSHLLTNARNWITYCIKTFKNSYICRRLCDEYFYASLLYPMRAAYSVYLVLVHVIL